MIVGILSDTHDRQPAAAAAVKMMLANGAQFLIHCGDVGTEQIFDQLAGTPAAFVWGNTDFDRRHLADYAAGLNIQCLNVGGELLLAGKKIFVTHGDLTAPINRVLAEQSHDYLLLGHTHVPLDERNGRVRVINPGALHRAARRTVALLDLVHDRLTYLDLPADAR